MRNRQGANKFRVRPAMLPQQTRANTEVPQTADPNYLSRGLHIRHVQSGACAGFGSIPEPPAKPVAIGFPETIRDSASTLGESAELPAATEPLRRPETFGRTSRKSPVLPLVTFSFTIANFSKTSARRVWLHESASNLSCLSSERGTLLTCNTPVSDIRTYYPNQE